jgi:hypothetical protein
MRGLEYEVTTSVIILWVYIVVLMASGLMGFFKPKSVTLLVTDKSKATLWRVNEDGTLVEIADGKTQCTPIKPEYLVVKTTISLATSAIYGVLLALCALGVIKPFYIADILLVLLLVVFGGRVAVCKRFMPSVLMLGLSAVVLAALLLLR